MLKNGVRLLKKLSSRMSPANKNKSNHGLCLLFLRRISSFCNNYDVHTTHIADKSAQARSGIRTRNFSLRAIRLFSGLPGPPSLKRLIGWRRPPIGTLKNWPIVEKRADLNIVLYTKQPPSGADTWIPFSFVQRIPRKS